MRRNFALLLFVVVVDLLHPLLLRVVRSASSSSHAVAFSVSVQLRKTPKWCYVDWNDQMIGQWLGREHVLSMWVELTTRDGLWLSGCCERMEWRDDGFAYLVFDDTIDEVPVGLAMGDRVAAKFAVTNSFSLQFQREMVISRMNVEFQKQNAVLLRRHVSIEVRPWEVEIAFAIRFMAASLPKGFVERHVFALHADVRCPNGVRLIGSQNTNGMHIVEMNDDSLTPTGHQHAQFNAWMSRDSISPQHVASLMHQVCAAVIRARGIHHGNQIRTIQRDVRITEVNVEHNGETISLQMETIGGEHESNIVAMLR